MLRKWLFVMELRNTWLPLKRLLRWGKKGPCLRPDQIFALLYPRLDGPPAIRLTVMGIYRAIITAEIDLRSCGEPCWFCTVVVAAMVPRGTIEARKIGEWTNVNHWTSAQMARQLLDGVGHGQTWRNERRYSERRFRLLTAGERELYHRGESRRAG
jgi:hypothetical protein